MSVGASLKAAAVDLYHQSWRLLILNSTLSAAVLGILLAASYAQPALVLLIAAGPLAAALMHCAVTLAETDELELGDAVKGLRLHWLRGIALTALAAAFAVFGISAVVFYARLGGAALPLAFAAGYVLVLFAAFQLLLWPLAIAERGRPLTAVLVEAGRALLRRPLATLALALALVLVNALGAIAVLPLLTLTVAYSSLAAAHFALPPKPLQEATY